MVAAEKNALNNEVFHISLYHFVIRSKRVNASVNISEMYIAHGDTRIRAQLGKCRTWPSRVQVYLDFLPW